MTRHGRAAPRRPARLLGRRHWRLLLPAAAWIGTACRTAAERDDVELRLWAMGREGEVVQQLMPEFERRHPGIRVRVQQVPWSAAHEKLLTGYVGGATPDVSQMGNTWVPEFAELDALEPLESWLRQPPAFERADFFPGIWATNVVNGITYGVPWYVDTRVLFYRTDLLARAGYASPPRTWTEWVDAMRRVKALGGPTEWAILLPLDEWALLSVLGFQQGSGLLREGGGHAAFSQPEFRRAFEFYISLFREGLAPRFSNTQIANLYQDFAAGKFAMYITGPWNLGEFASRLPPALQNRWATAPLPGPDSASGISFAGGSSLVMYRGSRHKREAWELIRFLSEPEQQVRFYRLVGDLPARAAAWRDPALADPRTRVFYEQLQRVQPLPQVPEIELIVTRLAAAAEAAARGTTTVDDALAGLDADVNRILEKRRWMLARRAARGG